MNKSHKGDISAKQRVLQFKDAKLHEDGGLLFCTTCNCVLDHTRKSTICDHIMSKKHVKRLSETESDEKSLKKQKTVGSAFVTQTKTQQERVKV